MIKTTNNIVAALAALKQDRNHAVAHLFTGARFGDGPLQGATFTIKDNFAMADAPMQASSQILLNFTPHYDATIVQKIKAAGGAIVAKVHGDELGLGGTGTFSAFGLITNPLDKTRLVGGSSSGSAATMHLNVSVSIGSDTGDSVRLPASYVGVYGFKPSYGAISRWGLTAFAASLDTVGYFAHNVHDLIVTSQVLFGVDERDMTSREVTKPTLKAEQPRVVVMLSNTAVLSEATREAYTALQKQLEKAGVIVKVVTLDETLLKAIETCYMVVAFSEASSNTANLSGINFGHTKLANSWNGIMEQTRSQGFGRMVQRRLTLGAFYLLKENQRTMYDKARAVRNKIAMTFNALYKDADLVIFPAASVAPLISEGKPTNWHSSYLSHANLSGNPSLVMPWIKEGNLPVGLALDGPLYHDAKLLRHALYLETLLGGEHE